MFARKNIFLLVFVLAVFFGVSRCGAPATPFRIIAGSGHTTFEPILKRFGQQHNVDIQMTYKGSLDIMYLLESGKLEYDAIWDGDSLWTTMGDTQHLIKDRESIMRSPVVFGVKKPLAEKLGWTGGKEVSVQEILQGIEQENLRVMMTSATQSNSGASAYLGFLNAFANPTGALTAEDLQKPDVQAAVKKLLASIDRTSESSGYLRDLFPQVYDSFDAMFNYESHIIELNQKLVSSGREPLYLVYPTPGLGIADFPLSYVDHEDPQKQKIFDDLQTYLLSDAVQQEIAAKCRRVGKVGIDQVDANCFVRDWGADAARGTTPMRIPDTQVVRQALDLYQSVLRKPSFTVYALDFSGSMKGQGEQQLKQAMRTLLDQEQARRYLLQGAPDDVTLVLLFDDQIINYVELQNYVVTGNNPQDLNKLLGNIQGQQTRGGTNIYRPVGYALAFMKEKGVGERLPAIILMTDGKSNFNNGSLDDVKGAIASTGLENVPVYGITFGDADASQLHTIADLTHGRVFDGTKDLISAFRRAKGGN
jgi:Ca-activated chloride channel family protein